MTGATSGNAVRRGVHGRILVWANATRRQPALGEVVTKSRGLAPETAQKRLPYPIALASLFADHVRLAGRSDQGQYRSSSVGAEPGGGLEAVISSPAQDQDQGDG